MEFIQENARKTPVRGTFDVIVAGSGPSGVCAALRAARSGAKTMLIEQNGCLGGMWTAGLLGWMIDHDKPESSLLKDLKAELRKRSDRKSVV